MRFDIEANACKGYPTEWWYPENNVTSLRNAKRALEICGVCMNQPSCLRYALQNETHGIWGGMREVERELLRRERGIPLTVRAETNMSNSARRVARMERKKEASLS